jgi:hypothetical protein
LTDEEHETDNGFGETIDEYIKEHPELDEEIEGEVRVTEDEQDE